MIYLTGDTHIPIDVSKLKVKNFPEQRKMTRNDYVIVLGDFGLLWRKNKTYEHWLNHLSNKKFTLLWIDGNHENHEWINSLEVNMWNGGKVHYISPNIIHLMRGQVFNIDGYKFFTCGGALSIDKEYRTEGKSWWPQELLSNAECEEALNNLESVNNEVDYILTHTCPTDLITPMFNIVDIYNDPTGKFLAEINNRVKFSHWYFGHWHEKRDYENFHCLYNNIVKLGDNSLS